MPVPEGKTVKNRLHIDLAPHIDQDRDALIEELLAKGASHVDVGQDLLAAGVVAGVAEPRAGQEPRRHRVDLGPARQWGERFPVRETAFAAETPPAR